MTRYFRYWYRATVTSFLSALADRYSFIVFILAKSLRIFFFFVFINSLLTTTQSLSFYNRDQIIFFFLNFYLIDSLSQLFLRGVYYFRNDVVEGSFDYTLTRPINALFNVLGSYADVQDLIIAVGLISAVVVQSMRFTIASPLQVLAYLILFFNGFLISVAFHIIIVSFILISLDVDHTIMVYRDIVSLARFPVEIYREPIRFILTFVVPMGVMVSFPAKAFLGILSPPLIVLSLLISLALFFIALKIWNVSLKSYSSASS